MCLQRFDLINKKKKYNNDKNYNFKLIRSQERKLEEKYLRLCPSRIDHIKKTAQWWYLAVHSMVECALSKPTSHKKHFLFELNLIKMPVANKFSKNQRCKSLLFSFLDGFIQTFTSNVPLRSLNAYNIKELWCIRRNGFTYAIVQKLFLNKKRLH